MKLHYYIEECLKIDQISLNCYHDLCELARWLHDASNWASKQTHYKDLDIWFNEVNGIIHNNLYKYGFINGIGPQNKDSELWWLIYQMDSAWSPNLKTSVSNHHSSAWERNEVLILEIEYLIKEFENKIKTN